MSSEDSNKASPGAAQEENAISEDKPAKTSQSATKEVDEPTAPTSKSPAADTSQPNEGNNGNTETEKEEEEKPISKNQLKKKRKWERAQEAKKRRKQHAKDLKVAKAKAEGRDLDKERAEQFQNQQDGTGRKQRQEKWERERGNLAAKSWQVCIDCSFEDQMSKKEINSLSGQIRYCYSSNRRSPHPTFLTVTSLTGHTLENLKRVSGFDEWTLRAFSHSPKPLNDVFADRLQDVVYLTSDSENVIEELDDSKIYVIGGIVDRNRLQRAAISRAEEWGLSTARLPLDTKLMKMKATPVLTCNHVFDILLQYRQHHKNWEKALLEVLPSRKDAKPVSCCDTTTATSEGATQNGTAKPETAQETTQVSDTKQE